MYLVDDLINEHELIGKTKEEVITHLGSPTETEYLWFIISVPRGNHKNR
ncbi:hypothetical protein ACIQYG_02405 [Peribacillus sp. NPDC096622]